MVEALTLDSTDPVTALSTTCAQDGDNTVIVSGSIGGSIHVRDIRFLDGVSDKVAKCDTFAISTLLVGRNYEIIAGDAKGNVNLWDMRSMRNLPIVSFNSNIDSLIPTAGVTEKLMIPIKMPRTADITEDMWDMAMGKRRKSIKQKVIPRPSMSEQIEKVPHSRAHAGRVLAAGFIQASSVATVGEDKTLKVFCTITGRLLHITKMRDKPTCAGFDSGILCFGTRGGFETTKFRDGSWSSPVKNSETHVGSVTAVDFVGEWGICTGGSDRHVFVNRIES